MKIIAMNDESVQQISFIILNPDHLGSSSWITNTSGQATQHLAYLPFGESFVSQRLAGAPARYTFSAKEKDTETGYSYFGARYYESDLSIWLSVDPLADKYPSLSSYVYCANNPVILVDPDGRWIPGLEEDGTTSYIAQKGDNIDTFIEQYDVTQEEAIDIFKSSGLTTNPHSSLLGGQEIKGKTVKNTTGNEVLKCRSSDKRDQIAHLFFALMHGNHNKTAPGGGRYAINVDCYFSSFATGYQLENVRIPIKGGGTIMLNFIEIAPSGHLGIPPLIESSFNLNSQSKQKDGSYLNSFNFLSARNPKAGVSFPIILFSIKDYGGTYGSKDSPTDFLNASF